MFFAALLENAQDISGIAQIEARERIEKRKDAVEFGVVRRDGRIVDHAQRNAIRTVGLAEPVILQIETAVIVKRGAPQHRAGVHHAVLDVADDLAVAKAARLFRHAQIAGIHEAHEFV